MERRSALSLLVTVFLGGCTTSGGSSDQADADGPGRYWSEQDREQAARDRAAAEAERERRRRERRQDRTVAAHRDETRRTVQQMRHAGRSDADIDRYEDGRFRDEINLVRQSTIRPEPPPEPPVEISIPRPE